MGEDLSTIEQFKDLLSQILKKDKKETLKTITESNLCGRGGAGFPTGMKRNLCGQQKVKKNMSFVMLMKVILVLSLTDIFWKISH